MHLTGIDVTAIWTSAATAFAVIVGLWVKWAITPVILAFSAGVLIGKILERREARRGASSTGPASPAGPAGWSNP